MRETKEAAPLNGILILIAMGVWLAPAYDVLDLHLSWPKLWPLRLLMLAADLGLVVLLATHRRAFRPAFAIVAALSMIVAAFESSAAELIAGAAINGIGCAYVLRSKAAARSFPR